MVVVMVDVCNQARIFQVVRLIRKRPASRQTSSRQTHVVDTLAAIA
jgi:hypothetical protein